ncbi:unnamed protein product [Ambrosiozyma monospora]|uniref:Unnamed protein product n=1 Tax=Ambrosiozyma monospora TaxID=43982 RepID=A0ACB5TW10_AMBMO|nr:unnamed protein product [Ambrosiozyma monospora]
MMAMDGVTSFSFGEKYYDPLLKDPFNRGADIIRKFLIQSSSWFWTTSMPVLYDIAVDKSVNKATDEVNGWIEEQFTKSLKSLDDPSQYTLITTLLDKEKSTVRGKPNLFDEARAKSEAFDHIAAGHNTTATTLSYLYYELASHPEMQSRLQKELKEFNNGNFKSTSDLSSFEYSEIEYLPYMNAIINETFRIYAAIPGQEPRIVPKGGLRLKSLNDVIVPQATVVTMQPWSLHRQPHIFENPEKFNPERWLIEDESKLKLMIKNMMHFGSGARMCVGMNLATCEIKLNVANVLSRYHVELVDGFDYEKRIQMKDIYTTVPDECNVPIVFKALMTS